jgi:subtilase family serine protease
MKRLVVLFTLCTISVLLLSAWLSAQDQRGTVVIPQSSIFRPEDAGIRAHTNIQLFYPGGVIPDSATPTGETPSSLGCVYGIVPDPQPGCPKNGTSNPTGGKHIIAIVDAYHYPNAESDLAVFSSTFGLPQAKFKQIHAGPVVPPENCGWEVEESLDIQWAHAMAPDAMIVLVEAQSNTYGKLLSAVDRAVRFIAARGGKGEITMSWSSGEFHREKTFDEHFKQPGIVYFASSGDTGGVVQYPAASPYIVSAGGTRVNRSNGDFTNETGWSGSGGGLSVFEKRPSFQDGIQDIVGKFRGIPDLSYDADPFSGASVYNTSTASCGAFQWFVVGGTSLSSPALAGIVNAAHKFKPSSANENRLIYNNLGNTEAFTDIISGHAGGFNAGPGWDFVTGVGTSLGFKGK